MLFYLKIYAKILPTSFFGKEPIMRYPGNIPGRKYGILSIELS